MISEVNMGENFSDINNIIEVLNAEMYKDLPSIIEKLDTLLVNPNLLVKDSISPEVITSELLVEILSLIRDDTKVYFGKTLKDIKIIMSTMTTQNKHEVFVKYLGPKKLKIVDTDVPYSSIQERIFGCLREVIHYFCDHLYSLGKYIYELNRIDEVCNVVEPVTPTLKQDYRRIAIDGRRWLHVEVSPEGVAHNIHIIGDANDLEKELQELILNWDYDSDIVDNINKILSTLEMPFIQRNISSISFETNQSNKEEIFCAICLCSETENGNPLPLCCNRGCESYFHRHCLCQWLISSGDGLRPKMGVINGKCPACSHQIVCEYD